MKTLQTKMEFLRMNTFAVRLDDLARKRLGGVLEYLIMMAVVGAIAVTVPGLVHP